MFEQKFYIVKKDNDVFCKHDFLDLPPTGDGKAWHLYILPLNLEKLSIDRNEFSSLLQEEGIGTSMHFIPHFRMSYIKNRYGLSEKDFPNADKQFQKSLSIPLWPGMNEEQINKVINAVIKIGKEHYGRT